MIKFVVWGAGNRGKDVVSALGKEYVVAVVDSNKALWGTLFREIDVISPETYFSKFNIYPIVITPEGHEQEIVIELENKGIFWYFLYNEEFRKTETYMRQIPKEDMFKKYNIDEQVCIYGFSLIGLLLYDELSKRGYKCRLILQDGVVPEIREYVGTLLKNNLINVLDVKKEMILSIPLKKNDLDNLQCECETYYDLIDKDIFYNPKIEKFRNIHAGQRCFIVGTGPSLKMEDLDTLKKHNEICISMNRIYMGFERTSWRPDYYVVSDLDAAYYGKEEIENMDVPNKFIADVAWCFDENRNDMYKWHLIRKSEKGKRPQFSEDFSKGSYAGMTITYDGGLQLAAYMGFKEIYLLGIDCCNYSEISTAHFFDEFAKSRKEEEGFLQIEANLLSYMSAKKYSEEHGFKIYNATRGGKLEIFERVKFDDLFT